MKKLPKKFAGTLSCLGLTLLLQGFWVSQADHPQNKSILEKQSPETPVMKNLLDIDPNSPEQVGRVLSSELPTQVAKQDTKKIAKNLVKMVINPLKGHKEILDAVKAIERYYTEEGARDFGIKVDI